MFENSWIKKQWDALGEAKRLREHHTEQEKAIKQAIKDKDACAISSLARQTDEPALFNREYYRDLLLTALNTDDVETFEATLKLRQTPSVNYKFREKLTNIHGFEEDRVTPLICKAMELSKEKIATALILNPKIDLDAQTTSSGFFAWGIWWDDHVSKMYNASQLADKKNIRYFTATLARRPKGEDQKRPRVNSTPEAYLS
jgi:hypothetical protein